MAVVFDLDDLCDRHDPYEELVALKKEIPGLKVTLFAIPCMTSEETMSKYDDLDWVEIGVHGYHHSNLECVLWTDEETQIKVEEGRQHLKAAKLFKAPGWAAHTSVYDALEEMDYAVADNMKLSHLWGDAEPKRYAYNADVDTVPLHGHTWDTMGNGPDYWTRKALEYKDAEFKFVSEVASKDQPKFKVRLIGHENSPGMAVYSKALEPLGDQCCWSEDLTEPAINIWSFWNLPVSRPEAFNPRDVICVHHFEGASTEQILTQLIPDQFKNVVVGCSKTQKEVERISGLVPTVIRYCVDRPAEVPPKSDTFRVGILGIEHPNKNFDLVREVCQEEGIELVDWTVGYQEKIPRERSIEPFYNQLAVYVVAATAEGGPLPPLEALARGRVVVTTDVGLMPEVESDAMIFFDGTKEDLILKLQEAKELWEKLPAENHLPEYWLDQERVTQEWKAYIDGLS
jgi:glycosyltransferase involved in cell wall biosynthesis